MPALVVSLIEVWNEVCPSVAVLVRRVPSFGDEFVTLLRYIWSMLSVKLSCDYGVELSSAMGLLVSASRLAAVVSAVPSTGRSLISTWVGQDHPLVSCHLGV